MDVIERNFMRLLRSGTFGDDTAIEPMSQWKWNRLYQMSLMHGVTVFIYDGIMARDGEFFINLTDEQRKTWRMSVEETEEKNCQHNILTARLIEQLNHLNTRPILLKGQAIATLYNHPLHRSCGDCDIFFPLPPQVYPPGALLPPDSLFWNGRQLPFRSHAKAAWPSVFQRYCSVRLQRILFLPDQYSHTAKAP